MALTTNTSTKENWEFNINREKRTYEYVRRNPTTNDIETYTVPIDTPSTMYQPGLVSEDYTQRATKDEVQVLRVRITELEERILKMEKEFADTVANLVKELSKENK